MKNDKPKHTVNAKDYKDPKAYWKKMRAAAYDVLGLTPEENDMRRAIKDPQQFWELACAYFQYCDDNPLYKNELVKSGKLAGKVIEIPIARPYQWAGFDRFLIEWGILGGSGHFRYNTDGLYGSYVPIIERIDQIMYSQKFENAVVNNYNATIISRDLKLAENVVTDANLNLKTNADYSNLSESALEEIAKLSENDKI